MLQIILSQEKTIQRLNEIVRSLRNQLRHCRDSNGTSNDPASSLTENVIEFENQQAVVD